MKGKSRHLKRPKIAPKPIEAGISLVDLIDGTFLAYNGARLREACQLFRIQSRSAPSGRLRQ